MISKLYRVVQEGSHILHLLFHNYTVPDDVGFLPRYCSNTWKLLLMNILELAKQGDAEAIAALMNRYLKPKGITAKTDVYKGCLQVSLESTQLPEKQVLVAFVYKKICDLKPAHICKVKVCGRCTNSGSTVWIQEFEPGIQTNPELALLLQDTNQNSLSNFKPLPLKVETKSEAEVKCIKCHSTQLSVNKKGFGLGKATVGAMLLDPVGLIGGTWGSNHLLITCLKCGHQWQPGKT